MLPRSSCGSGFRGLKIVSLQCSLDEHVSTVNETERDEDRQAVEEKLMSMWRTYGMSH